MTEVGNFKKQEEPLSSESQGTSSKHSFSCLMIFATVSN
ncbi:hypothetical protein CUZ89_1867 [Enterococcus xinjiangensis]|nr:hypothetical protein [Enterococcus lactis]MBL4998291.1 hypothetical protein [Enterococcus lactis]MBL5003684.1 hypothetical protein [Enterococcus lactis]MBL5015094.1 hypothetical protein [Enterococcus lactis]